MPTPKRHASLVVFVDPETKKESSVFFPYLTKLPLVTDVVFRDKKFLFEALVRLEADIDEAFNLEKELREWEANFRKELRQCRSMTSNAKTKTAKL